jgi:hypothetical protein
METRAAVVVGGCVIWTAGTRGKAFALALPFAVFVAPALGLAVQNSPGMLPLVLILHSFVSWPAVVSRYADSRAWRIAGIPVAAALRWTPEEQTLMEHREGYAAARAIERIVPEQAKVLTLCPAPQAYTTRRLFEYAESAAGELAFQSLVAAYQSATRQLVEMHFRFSPQPLHAIRVAATREANELWSVNEMRVFLGGAEVNRRPAWRVTAMPNSRDSPRAFDNNEVTAWSTWQAVRPGMYLELEFDGPVMIDDVVLLSGRNEAGTKLRAEGLGVHGGWRTLAETAEISAHVSPPGLRRAAEEEVKSQGFDYVVVRDDEGSGRDMLRYPSYWGFTRLEEIGDTCVFRLD